jgi:hypothetical protein
MEESLMALFLRYCAPCNSTTSVAERDTKGLKCAECGGPLKIVDAFALIPALGAKLDIGQRESATADLQGHDLPRP